MAKYITLDNLSTFLTQLKSKYELTDTKVTSVDNHYKPTTSPAQATSGLYKVTIDAAGHVTASSAVQKADITALGIPGSNTDTNVTQTVTTSNANYPLLLAPSGQTATTTGQSYFDSGVTLNPSTNLIAANINGYIKGSSLNNVNEGYTDLNFKFYNNISGCDTTVSTDGKRYAGSANSYGFPVSNNANAMLWMGAYSGNYGHQLGFSSDGRIYDRYISNGSFPTTVNGGSWKKMAWTSEIPTKFTGTAAEHNHTFTGTKVGHTHTFSGSASHDHTFSGTAATHTHTVSSTGTAENTGLTISYSNGELTITTTHTHTVSATGTSTASGALTVTGTVGSKTVTISGTTDNTDITPAGTIGNKSLTPAGTLSVG